MAFFANIVAELSRSFAGAPRADVASQVASAPTQIRSSWPIYEEDEVQLAANVLRSGRVNSLAHGECTKKFQDEFAKYIDMPYAIAVANGTVSLELALRSLGVGPGDEVVVTSRSFIASASCVMTCGATPVFADVDPITQNITAETVRAVLTPKTRAIIAVHLAGLPCEMDELCALTEEKGLFLIEDCAQAHGATYRDRKVGSFGHASAFSFCTDKIMSTAGEGGMVLLRNEAHWRRAWSYKDHGKDYELFTKKSPGLRFRWIHNSIGTNFRITEFQAAIGLKQLSKLDDWLEQRRLRASILDNAFEGLSVVRTTPRWNHIGPAHYKYYIFVRPEKLKPDWTRNRILVEAAARGVPCQSGSCSEIYRERAFGGGGDDGFVLAPNAHVLGDTSILLPVDHTLKVDDVRQMGAILREVAEEAAAD